jgi:hypothetical protein
LLPLAGADFATLNLKVLEGEGMAYAPGSRATRGISIEVSDELGRPVPGVSVSFQLPDDGPSGVFLNGAKADIVNTGEDGRATVWGMRWSKTPGVVNVRITAAKQGVRAGIIVAQRLDAAAVETAPAGWSGGKRHSKALIITIAVAGAAGAGLAAAALGGGSKSASASVPTPTLTIGNPTVTIGAPQ